jgi:ABC-2 type transport system permease protein
VGVGAGGSATFQFDIPNSHHLHFHRLVLSVNAGGADGSKVAQVYDWHKNRWVHVDLGSNDVVLTTPARYVSSAGALQIRLHATSSSGDIVITDPLEDVQLSGTATVE